MKFEPKISGTTVTEFKIKPIFEDQTITLLDCLEKIRRQESMNFLLDTYRFVFCKANGEWYTILDWDSIMKVSVLENYPDYEAEFINYFGENWINHYIRFNH